MTFLLIHGAWHGAWCYGKFISVLESRGENAVAIDLPGHEAGGKPGWGISMDDYASAVCDAASKIDGPVHLVGHSMGGLVVSTAAEKMPEAFTSLTYLAAFLVNNENLLGQSPKMKESKLSKGLKSHPFSGYVTVKQGYAQDSFYNCCADEEATNAETCLLYTSPSPRDATLSRMPSSA